MSARNTPRKTVLKMTKGHFQFIAEVIASIPELEVNFAEYIVPINDEVAVHFANKLAQTNANFDRQTFLDACRRLPPTE